MQEQAATQTLGGHVNINLRFVLVVLMIAIDGAAYAQSSRNVGRRAKVDVAASASATSTPLHYGQVPYVFTQSPTLFENLILGAHATPTRITFLGDSTATDQIGYGQEHMNWRRWLWHFHFGHTPGTQLCRLGNFGGSPSAEFIFMGTIAYPQPGVVGANYLPPGYSGGAAFSQRR
jgi:hypothetical protein